MLYFENTTGMSNNWSTWIIKHPLLKCSSCSVSFLRNKNARVDFANNCSGHHFVAAAAGGSMDCRRACACSREVGHPQCRLSRCCTVTGAVTLVPARHWPALGQSQVSPASPASPLTAPPVHPRTPGVTPQRYLSEHSESKVIDFDLITSQTVAFEDAYYKHYFLAKCCRNN